MIIILDSNEYIIFLNKESALLNQLLANENITIYSNDTIIKEVLRNVEETVKGEFYKMLFKNNVVIKNEKLAFSLIEKYRNLGLKKGDIIIAAFCESVNASFLVSENRHFLKDTKFDKFKVVKLREFLTALGKHSEV